MKGRTRTIIELAIAVMPIILMFIVGWIRMTGSNGDKLTVMVLLILVFLVAIGFLYLQKPKLAFNHLMFMAIVTAVIGSLSFFVQGQTFLYMPLLISVMLITMIVDEQIGIMMHLALTAMIALVVDQGTVFLIYYGVLGLVTGLTINYAKQRNKMLMVVGGLGIFSAVLIALLTYAVQATFTPLSMLIAFSNTALSIIIVVGSLPLWESIFKVMTPLKLMEFANTEHKLIQRLLIEAPGTYHHVQMVGNLAERGAKAIGANSLLAKTAAIYHDIGKLKAPGYFIENQNGGPNPHDDIAAEDSARMIIEHVSEGVRLGRDHKLPDPIISIIREHHGTSLVAYFYHKAQNYKDGVEYPESGFRYDGPKPQTKESAVVMLADCVEAFVRSLSEQDRNLDKIRWIIDEIKRQKFEDGQLDECDIQVSELKDIGEAFMQVYKGLYHERIAYPE